MKKNTLIIVCFFNILFSANISNAAETNIYKKIDLFGEVLKKISEEYVDEINQLIKKITDLKHVKAVSPYVSGEGLLSNRSVNRGVLVKGIDPQYENNVNQLLNKVAKGSKKFSSKPFEIIIGVDLARLLDVDIGDDVSLLIPKLNFSPIGNYPTIKKFHIVGIFDAGIYEFDSSLALIDYQDAQKIFFKNQKTKFSAMQIQLTDSNKTLNVEPDIKKILIESFFSSIF